jgi:tRNA (guanosine-2'-O-)-methyltransferase
MMLTEEREAKLRRVAAFRQKMTVILENVHDPHNIGAVLRTCDAVGIQEIYVIYTDAGLDAGRLDDIKVSSTGVRKWMDIHVFDDVDACFRAVNAQYDTILATHLDFDSQSTYQTDLTGKVAILLGNEKDGISTEALRYADKNILIPQFGMVQSLNISVACATILYESSRQRQEKNMYQDQIAVDDTWRCDILNKFMDRHK